MPVFDENGTMNPQFFQGFRQQAKGDSLPPLWDKDGYDLEQALLNNRFQGPSSGLFACMAIAAAYNFGDELCDAVRSQLRAASFVKIAGNGVLIPNTVRFSCQNGWRFYAVAGTTNLLQWGNYLFPQNQRACAGVPGQIYQAFADTADDGYAAILNDARQRPKSQPIAIVGHSLGGAMAELWAHKLVALDGFGFVGSTSYGAPRFGTPDYADASVSGVSLERVVTAADTVTNVLPSIFTGRSNDIGGSITFPVARYRHKKSRYMEWGDRFYERKYTEDGTVSAALSDMAALFTDTESVIARHRLLRYGRLALARSFISDATDNSPVWQRSANGFARGLFG